MTLRDIPAALWLALVLGLIPINAIVVARRARARGDSERTRRTRALPRAKLYRLSVWGQAQLLLITLAFDAFDHGSVVRKALAFPANGAVWIVVCVAAHQAISVTTMAIRRWRRIPLDPGIARLLPRTGTELAWFAPLALGAGIFEEFMYRGFAPDHLARWGLPATLAVLVATVSFALAHGYKSTAGVVRSGVVGLVLALPVLVTGTLLPSIVAHVLMDLIAGANTLPLARRLGVAIPEETATPAAEAPAMPPGADATQGGRSS